MAKDGNALPFMLLIVLSPAIIALYVAIAVGGGLAQLIGGDRLSAKFFMALVNLQTLFIRKDR